MSARIVLRLLVVVHLLLVVLGVGLSFFDEHLLPPALADWKAAHAPSDDLSLLEFAWFASWLMWMTLYVVACVGLLCLQRWAAFMLLVLTVVGFAFTLTEPNVTSALLAVLDDAAMLCMGALLATCFLTDALHRPAPAA
jgi:uncharacterized membrane protein